MNKICIKCDKEKTEKEFSWKLKTENLRHNICKECKRNVDNNYYKNSSKRRKSIRSRALLGYRYLTEYVQRLKKFGKCKNCGEKRWYVLDFHHIKGKDNSISYIQHTGSIELLKKELKKCVLLCSNCHREEHHFLRTKQ